MKIIRIRSYSGQHFPAFEKYGEIHRISVFIPNAGNVDQNNSGYGYEHFLRSVRVATTVGVRF